MFPVSCALFIISVSFFIAAYVRHRRNAAWESVLTTRSQYLIDYESRIQASRTYILDRSKAFDKAVKEYTEANNVKLKFNAVYNFDSHKSEIQCRILSL